LALAGPQGAVVHRHFSRDVQPTQVWMRHDSIRR
jgi:hypothetical protein